MKVLLTGAEGQLGFSIKKLTPKGIQLFSLNKNHFDLSKLNTIKKVKKTLNKFFFIFV